MANNKTFPEYFPEGCPPSGVKDIPMEVYRLCSNKEVAPEDFKSKFEEKKLHDLNLSLGYGVSINPSKNQLVKARELITPLQRFKYLAKGETSSELGVHKKTSMLYQKSHRTWWLYVGAKPHEHFEIDEELK